jgi:V/A-type H+/Na+-transporting ATPase subunit F
MQIRVIGHPDAVLGFALAGVTGMPVQTEAEAAKALDEVLELPEAGIVLVTKDAARLLHGRMENLKLRSSLPLVVEIPSPEGKPEGEASLGELVLRAIGIRL